MSEISPIDQGLEEAAQVVFSAAAHEGRLGQLEEVLHAVQGPAVRGTLEARVEQIVRYGHDAAADAARKPEGIARDGLEHIDRAIEILHEYRARGGDRHLRTARKKLERGAAVMLAAIDRLIAEEAEA